SGAEVVEARDLVLAPGAHDGVLAFEGNDLPGVMSARAPAALCAHRVVPGEHVVLVVAPRGAPHGAAMAEALAAHADVTLLDGESIRAKGTSRLKEVSVRGAAGDVTLRADALLIEAPRAPAYELCAQAGASLAHEPRGYIPRTDGGKIRDRVWAVGE